MSGCSATKQGHAVSIYTPTYGPKAEANPTNYCTDLFVETECCRRVFPVQWEGNPRRSWSVPGNHTESGNIPWYTPQSSASLLYLHFKLRTGTCIVIFLDTGILHWCRSRDHIPVNDIQTNKYILNFSRPLQNDPSVYSGTTAKQCWAEQKTSETVIFEKSEKFLVQNQSEFHNSTAPSHKNLWGVLLLSIWQTFIRDRHESETPEQIAFKVTHWIIHFLPDILYIG